MDALTHTTSRAATRNLRVLDGSIAPLAADVESDLPALGPRPTMAWIDKACFAVDDSYQRDANREGGRRVIRRIVENFTWRKFQPPTVAQIADGRFVAIDGQHRIAAALQHPKIKDIPCYIIEAPEIRQQADAFVAINRDRASLNVMQMHHAALAAQDPDALHLQAVCDEVGAVIPRNGIAGNDRKPNHLLCLGGVSTLLKEYGDKPVVTAMRLMIAAKCDMRRSVLVALTQFLVAYKRLTIDEDRLQRVLSARSAKDIEDAGRAYKKLFPHTKTEVAVRMALVSEYNKGLRQENKLPERAA